MHRTITQILTLVVFTLPLFAQAPDWKTATELPQVDMSALDAEQKTQALKILREQKCQCPCGMFIAQCRIDDRNCPVSPGLAATVVKGVASGKSHDAIVAELAKQAPAPRPAPTPMATAAPAPGAPAPAPAPNRPPQPPAQLIEPAVTIPIDGSPAKGPEDAAVTIVEFSDFQCPYCSKAIVWIDSVLEEFPDDVRLVFKQYPLAMHKQAKMAAEVSLAAHAEGKFWPMHDKLFENYRQLKRDLVPMWADQVGLKAETITKALEDGTYREAVEQDLADGNKVGVRGTPTFFVNGKRYSGPRTLEAIKPLIEAELAAAKTP